MSATARWLRCPNPRPDARIRLICFPHAGGTAGFFRAWPGSVSSEIETHLVQYPGREDRIDEPLIDRMELLVERIVEALPDGPLALFGHSMGAAVAYEVAVRLRQAERNPVAHLFISGREPPAHQRHGDVHTREAGAVAGELARLSPRNATMLGDPALTELILPTVINDYRLIETYRPSSVSPLHCPITALIGDRDTEVSISEARDWARCTTGHTRVWRMPGDHFFLADQGTTVMDVVSRALRVADTDERAHRTEPRRPMATTGTPSIPMKELLNLRAFSADPYSTMQRLYRDNRAISQLGEGTMRFWLALGPEACEFILSNSQLFSWERAFAELVPVTGSAALLANDGDRHRRLRRQVMPAFTARRVVNHIGTVTRHIERTLAGWNPGDIVEVYDPLRRALRLATLESLFGAAATKRAEGLNDWLHDIHRAIDTDVLGGKFERSRGAPTWQRAVLARASVHRWVVAEIERRSEHAESHRDVLGALLEGADDTRLTDEEITDQLVGLLLAGTETTVAQLSWVLYCTLRDRSIWTNITAQIADRLPADRPPSPENLTGLADLEHIVCETLRLYPATAIVPRMAATEFTLAGKQFAAGDLLIFSPYHTHRLPSVWSDPERFEPRRWEPGSDCYHHPAPHEFLPFGGGPHRCVGAHFAMMAVKTALVAVARHIDCELLTADAAPTGLVGMRPRDGLTVRIDRKR
jgi:cytochrome P450/surfactin synthase thioesterase subunit